MFRIGHRLTTLGDNNYQLLALYIKLLLKQCRNLNIILNHGCSKTFYKPIPENY